MKEAIKSKMDEHVKQILDKPAITNEDYALLQERLRELRADDKAANDPFMSLAWTTLFTSLLKGGFHS